MERLGLGLWTRETGDSGQQTEKRRRTEDNILTVSIQPHAPRHRAIQRRRHTVRPQCTTNPVLRSGMVGTREASLELSTLPPLNLDQRLGSLIQYPHGCAEQTTSGAFPQLYLSTPCTT